MKFVATDLGASNTRYTMEKGAVTIMPNNMVIGLDEYTHLESNEEELVNNLEFKIEKEGASEHFPVIAMAGKMAERYSINTQRPSMLTHKYNQRINYISAVLAVASAKIEHDIEDEDIVLVMDVPPVETYKAREAFQSLIGKYTVTFPKYNGGTVVKFNIIHVDVNEESVMAMFSFFFNMNGTIKKEHEDLGVGKVLSIDIGASTSDLALIEDRKYIDLSGKTYKTGGNIVRAEFINAVREEYGYELPIADAEKAIAEGRLQQGNSFIDVGKLVDRAKRELAARLSNDIQTYFTEINTPIQTIRAIVVSGGGSIAGSYVNADGEEIITSSPVATFITDELKSICPGVDAIPYGKDARLANIIGLYIKASVLMNKLKKEMAAPVPTPVQPVQTQPVQSQSVQVPPVSQPVQAQPVAQTVVTPTPAPAPVVTQVQAQATQNNTVPAPEVVQSAAQPVQVAPTGPVPTPTASATAPVN